MDTATTTTAVSSSSAHAPARSKRTYSLAQLNVVCVDDIDAEATAAAILEDLRGDLQQTCDVSRKVARTAKVLEHVRDRLNRERIEQYGETFRCSKCKRDQTVDSLMTVKDSKHPAYVTEPDAMMMRQNDYCAARICYDCAMQSGTTCPICNRDIEVWYDGPADKPYIIVLDTRQGAYGRLKRVEKPPSITVRELRTLLNVQQKDKVRVAGTLTGNKQDATLESLGVTAQWFRLKSHYDTWSRPKITISYK